MLTPRTGITDVAEISFCPTVDSEYVTLHEKEVPVPSAVYVHVLLSGLPGPLMMFAVTVCIPESIGLPPREATVIVNVCVAPTTFVAVGGAIEIFAFTNVLETVLLPEIVSFPDPGRSFKTPSHVTLAVKIEAEVIDGTVKRIAAVAWSELSAPLAWYVAPV
jgi:hypothetical protein